MKSYQRLPLLLAQLCGVLSLLAYYLDALLLHHRKVSIDPFHLSNRWETVTSFVSPNLVTERMEDVSYHRQQHPGIWSLC